MFRFYFFIKLQLIKILVVLKLTNTYTKTNLAAAVVSKEIERYREIL